MDLDHELTAMGHSDRLGDMVICTEELSRLSSCCGRDLAHGTVTGERYATLEQSVVRPCFGCSTKLGHRCLKTAIAFTSQIVGKKALVFCMAVQAKEPKSL